jgi:hypothetical protein
MAKGRGITVRYGRMGEKAAGVTDDTRALLLLDASVNLPDARNRGIWGISVAFAGSLFFPITGLRSMKRRWDEDVDNLKNNTELQWAENIVVSCGF